LGLAALAIARIMRLPVGGTYHTAIPQYAHILTGDGSIEELVWRYTIWFYEQLDWVLAPSNSTADELIGRGLDPEKIRLFPRGVDTQQFHPAKRDPDYLKKRFGLGDGLKILYVGRISKEKDLHLLVRAFDSIRSKFQGAELVLAGNGPYFEELQEKSSGMPCTFTGYVEGEELARLYAGCDIFVFPSATDTFGNVVLEAQASGLPVIVTDSGGPQENIIPNKTGLIVKAGNLKSLEWGIETLLMDRLRRKEMGRAARLNMEKRSHDLAFEKTWLIYRDCGNDTEQEMAAAI
jgi:glycosyltransferase involved in cell wall biosynthesis